jgi:Rad3-related DNA helicase
LLFDAADVAVLISAFLGHRAALAECLGLDVATTLTVRSDSPFPLEQRPIVYRPRGALSRATLAELEPAVFSAVADILRAHARDKGVIHVPSYAAADRLVTDLARRVPLESRRLLPIATPEAKPAALQHHRASHLATVLVSPSLREGVDLPDDLLRFQIVTKMPFPDLGDPWTAARARRDPRWYALETAKSLVQTYGRSCRHADDRGVTYLLDGQFSRFLLRYRPLLPSWFLDAAEPALRQAKREGQR